MATDDPSCWYGCKDELHLPICANGAHPSTIIIYLYIYDWQCCYKKAITRVRSRVRSRGGGGGGGGGGGLRG